MNFPKDGASISETATFDADYTHPTPSREGYTFIGWFDEAGNEYTDGKWAHTADVTLTARWSENT